MAEVFVHSGSKIAGVGVPGPNLQGIFISEIDVPDSEDGFGLVVPFGGGSTARRYKNYGVSAEVSSQRTQLNSLSVAGGLGGDISYNFEGLVGPQGIPGRDGLPGITTVIGLPAYNSNFLTALPHNIDEINDLGTAADKLVYTSAYTAYLTFTWFNSGHTIGSGSRLWDAVASDSDGSNLIVGDGYIYTSDDSGATWTQRRPAGATDRTWQAIASDSDGSNLIVGALGGRLYTSSDYGVNWVERQPAGDVTTRWTSVASDGGGSHLIACEIGGGGSGGRVYTSSDSGVSWVERRPIDDNDYVWRNVASDDDGSVLGATLNGSGDVYISTDSGSNWTARQPGGGSASWWGISIDNDGSNLIVAAYIGRLYTSDDGGVNWTERQPAGASDEQWAMTASDGDGSHLIAGGYTTKLWVSGDFGITWVQQRPSVWTGIYTWIIADFDDDGSNLIIAQENGLLYTGTLATNYQLATWAESTITSAGRGFLDDATQGAQQTTLGLGTGDSPTWVGATLTGLTDNSFIYPVSGVLTSLGGASNGQLPIGSTGATPVLAGLTGTANQVNVANGAGTITLSLPQDYDTAATPQLGKLGVGDDIAPSDGTLKVHISSVDTTVAYYGFYNRHTKMLGVTDTDDNFYSYYNKAEYNQAGGELGNTYGFFNSFKHTAGDIGADGTTKFAYAVYHDVTLDGGKVWGDVRCNSMGIIQGAGHEITGSLSAMHLYVDADGTVGGVTTLLRLTEGSNVDYGIYQGGTAQNYFGGRVTTTGLTVTNCAVLGSDSAVFQPNVDAVDSFQINDALGGSVFTVDTVDKAVMIDTDLGAELITNGGFDTDSDWTKGAGWTIPGGAGADCTGSATLTTAAVIAVDAGSAYRVIYTITAWTSGEIAVRIGSQGTYGVSRGETGTFIEDLIAGAGGVKKLQFDGRPGGGTFVGSIDDVSVKAINDALLVDGNVCAEGSGEFSGTMRIGEPTTTARLAVQGDFGLEDSVGTLTGTSNLWSSDTGLTIRSTTSYVRLTSSAGNINFRANTDTVFSDGDGSNDWMTIYRTSGFLGLNEPVPETLLELTHATPYITTQCSTHENSDGGRESRWIGKGNKTDETEHTLGIVEFGHDGTGDDYDAYWKLSLNKTSGTQDTLVDALLVQKTGDWVINKTSGVGIKVDLAAPTFGFADIIGDQFSKNTGGTKPTLTVYNGAVEAWQFSDGDEAFMSFHIPHDYVPSTDIHLHIHWSQNNAGATGGTIDFKYFAIYAKGWNQVSGSTFTSTPITDTFSSIDINDGDSGLSQYQHHLTEVTISAATATAALFERDDFEPDGVIELTLEMDANNLTGTPSDPFIHYVDIHYQTTGIFGTKSRTPDFYG